MDEQRIRTLAFAMRPQLLTKQLGSDLYTPSQALTQLVANSLDAGCSRVDIDVEFNELTGPVRLIISDDGHGMTPEMVDQSFAVVGLHVQNSGSKRETIGSRGIGRFAAFALAIESDWVTVAEVSGESVRQSWTLTERLKTQIRTDFIESTHSGTKISLALKPIDSVVRLFSSVQRVKRTLFNAFAGYLLRYRDEVGIWVNCERIEVDEYIEYSHLEIISPTEAIPEARLHHLVLGYQVEQDSPCMLQFATHGATITSRHLDAEGIPGKKYLGLVDSPYLTELTNTAKSDLAMMDDRFRALEQEAVRRAAAFVEGIRGDRIQSFLEEARAKVFYPYKEPPRTIIDSYSREVYDSLLASLTHSTLRERS